MRLVLVMDDSRGDSHVVEAETEKKVLAIYKGRKRTLCFTSTGGNCDNDEILKAFITTFQDQLHFAGEAAKPDHFFLQIKDEEWGGEFVDVHPTDEIADHSILQVLEVAKISFHGYDYISS